MAKIQGIDTDLLLRARLRKGWTLRDVERQCWDELNVKVDNGNLNRYENGTLLPSPKALLAIATVLGLTVDDLLITEAA